MTRRRWRPTRRGSPRLARFALPDDADPLLKAARGNRAVIEAFLADGRYDAADKRALLESLPEKDLVDATAEVLEDAIAGALPFKERYPRAVWVEGVLCPRVWVEMLYPARARLRGVLETAQDAPALWGALCAKLNRCEMEPARLLPDLADLLDYGWGSAQARDVLFVAAARARGIAAKLDPATGEKLYWKDGTWRALFPARQATARLTLRNGVGRPLAGGVDFSVAVLENGAFRPLELFGSALDRELALPLSPGRYRVTAVSRQIDGSIAGRLWQVALGEGDTKAITLTLRPDRTAEKLLRKALPPLAVWRGAEAFSLPEALGGSRAIVAVVAPGQEPTEHFLNELLEAKDALAAGGIAVWLAAQAPEQLENEKLRRVLREVPNVQAAHSPDAAALLGWREAMNARELRLPLAVAVGKGGEGLFAFVNYNVGSVMTLIKILDAE